MIKRLQGCKIHRYRVIPNRTPPSECVFSLIKHILSPVVANCLLDVVEYEGSFVAMDFGTYLCHVVVTWLSRIYNLYVLPRGAGFRYTYLKMSFVSYSLLCDVVALVGEYGLFQNHIF